MMRILAATISLALILAFSASAADRVVNPAEQIVVDKSTRNKVLNDYVLLTRDAIQRAWTTPVEMTSASAVKGHVTINYTVSRSGAVNTVELVGGSGNEEMDRTLLAAIRKAAPFPPFPDDIAARKMLIKAKFIVAEMPTIPVTTVDAPVKNHSTPQDVIPGDDARKFKWGTPAETSSRDKLVTTDTTDAAPPRPQFQKYRWGLEP
jgi:TonB family protein